MDTIVPYDTMKSKNIIIPYGHYCIDQNRLYRSDTFVPYENFWTYGQNCTVRTVLSSMDSILPYEQYWIVRPVLYRTDSIEP